LEEIDLYSLMRPKMVCICKQVSEKEIVQCIKNGATTFQEISDATQAATNCGTCSAAIHKILERELKKGRQ